MQRMFMTSSARFVCTGDGGAAPRRAGEDMASQNQLLVAEIEEQIKSPGTPYPHDCIPGLSRRTSGPNDACFGVNLHTRSTRRQAHVGTPEGQIRKENWQGFPIKLNPNTDILRMMRCLDSYVLVTNGVLRIS